MRALFLPPSGRSSLGVLLAWTVGGCIFIFVLLQFWRPYFFLTDDNFSGGLPILTEMGRHLKAGRTPFTSDYLFGGNYNYLRDFSGLLWHPIYLLPSLLADTPARFWIVDLAGLQFLVLTTVGFTILAHQLREEFSVKLPDVYLIFYTLSFVFSTYTLTIGSSWLNFIGTQSCLPWLVLGLLDRKVLRGTALVMIFTIHELICGYSAMVLSTGICLSFFAVGVAIGRRSPTPLFCWSAGNLLALLILSPLLLSLMDGFAHSARIHGFSIQGSSDYSFLAQSVPFSFFLGNWSELLAKWSGDPNLTTLTFPYLSSLLACPAAWCFIPSLVGSRRWTYMEFLCLWIAGFLVVMIIRPEGITAVMQNFPIFKSMRWPFREGLQLLFFIHLLLILRPQERFARWQPAICAVSLTFFLLPLPFIRVPTLNALDMDRRLLFSGEAEAFWAGVKTHLNSTDNVATVLDWDYWVKNSPPMPYTVLGTANFPAFFQFRCISGYSPTAPADQMPLKTTPYYWFGAYRENQVSEILAQRPDLKLIRIESSNPLKITMSSGSGPAVDLTPYLQSAAVTNPSLRPAQKAEH